jgi:hypothetical protein
MHRATLSTSTADIMARDVPQARVAGEGLQHLVAVHLRHHVDSTRSTRRFAGLQRLAAVLGEGDGVAELLEARRARRLTRLSSTTSRSPVCGLGQFTSHLLERARGLSYSRGRSGQALAVPSGSPRGPSSRGRAQAPAARAEGPHWI